MPEDLAARDGFFRVFFPQTDRGQTRVAMLLAAKMRHNRIFKQRLGTSNTMIMGQAPPQTLFKYLHSEIYEDYFRQGMVRLGVSSYYRKQYELGSGFGDSSDGVRSASFPSVGQKASTGSKHFLFCFSRSYSYTAHELWLQRKNCGYDLCLALDGRAAVKALVEAARKQLGTRLMMCGACDYGDHQSQVNALSGNIFGDTLLKPLSYENEDEFRLAIALGIDDEDEPLNLLVPTLPSTVKRVIRLTSS